MFAISLRRTSSKLIYYQPCRPGIVAPVSLPPNRFPHLPFIYFTVISKKFFSTTKIVKNKKINSLQRVPRIEDRLFVSSVRRLSRNRAPADFDNATGTGRSLISNADYAKHGRRPASYGRVGTDGRHAFRGGPGRARDETPRPRPVRYRRLVRHAALQ